MPDHKERIAEFIFSIILYRDSDGQLLRQVSGANTGIPKELIITNMKAFVQRTEKEFLDEFEGLK